MMQWEQSFQRQISNETYQDSKRGSSWPSGDGFSHAAGHMALFIFRDSAVVEYMTDVLPRTLCPEGAIDLNP